MAKLAIVYAHAISLDLSYFKASGTQIWPENVIIRSNRVYNTGITQQTPVPSPGTHQGSHKVAKLAIVYAHAMSLDLCYYKASGTQIWP